MSSIIQQSTRRAQSLMASTSTYRLRSTCPPGTRIASVRQQRQRCFNSGAIWSVAKKGESREDLNPQSSEYSQSEGDAAATDSAFDESTTSPERGSQKVERESGQGSPMNVSPGNPDVNKRRPEENQATAKSTGEAGEGSERQRTSGGGSPKKAGGGQSG